MLSHLRGRIESPIWLGRNSKIPGLKRAISNYLNRGRVKRRGGGVSFVDPENLFRDVKLKKNVIDDRSLAHFVDELKNNQCMRDWWTDAAIGRNIDKYTSWDERVDHSHGNVAIYYALPRLLHPKIVVETGTATGSMTSFLLAALQENKAGKLISIDIPPEAEKLTMDITVGVNEIGYWIPKEYKSAWDYRIGDAKILLPQVLAENEVDFFVHDSLHTRTHMVFEYSVARCLMRPGGIIASDDILWNNGFDDFLALNKLIGFAPYSNPNIGLFVNEFDDLETEIGTGIISV